jgi:hypothetical protein
MRTIVRRERFTTAGSSTTVASSTAAALNKIVPDNRRSSFNPSVLHNLVEAEAIDVGIDLESRWQGSDISNVNPLDKQP